MRKSFKNVVILLALLALSGCGGSGGDDSPFSSPDDGGGDSSPTVPGTPDVTEPSPLGALQDLGDPIGDVDSWFWTEAAAINGNGLVVGQANNSDNGSPKEAFLWDPTMGIMTPLGGHSGGPYSDYYFLEENAPDDWLIYSEAVAINDSATILGHSTTGAGWPEETERRAFMIRPNGTFVDLPPLPYFNDDGELQIGTFSQANDINEQGNVLVTLDDEEGRHAWFWDGTTFYPDGTFAFVIPGEGDEDDMLLPIPDVPRYQSTCRILGADSEGVALNELRHAVINSGGTAVWCDIDRGIVESLNGFDGSSVGVDINNQLSLSGSGNQVSHITGNSAGIAFFWDGGAMLPLGTLADDDSGTSEAVDINDLDQVVGNATTSEGNTHAFLWDNSTKVMTDLGTLGGDNSFAVAVNDAGQVVGYSETGESYDQQGVTRQIVHAFLWDNGVMYDLGAHNDFYAFSFGAPYPFSEAVDINDNGDVAGFSFTINNHRRSFYLNPDSLP